MKVVAMITRVVALTKETLEIRAAIGATQITAGCCNCRLMDVDLIQD